MNLQTEIAVTNSSYLKVGSSLCAQQYNVSSRASLVLLSETWELLIYTACINFFNKRGVFISGVY